MLLYMISCTLAKWLSHKYKAVRSSKTCFLHDGQYQSFLCLMLPDVPGIFGGRHGQAPSLGGVRAKPLLPDPWVSCLAAGISPWAGFRGNLAAACESVLPDPWVSCLAAGINPGAGSRGNLAAVAAVTMHVAEVPFRVHGWNAGCGSLGGGSASGFRLT